MISETEFNGFPNPGIILAYKLPRDDSIKIVLVGVPHPIVEHKFATLTHGEVVVAEVLTPVILQFDVEESSVVYAEPKQNV